MRAVFTALLDRGRLTFPFCVQVRDLIGGDASEQLQLKEDPAQGVFVKDLSTVPVSNCNMLNEIMEKGVANRSVAATLMNATSSR